MKILEITSSIENRLDRLFAQKFKHSALLIREMDVLHGEARVDLALLGKNLIGIEIKGPHDTLDRLENQVKAYSKCFEFMFLVVSIHMSENSLKIIPPWWGVIDFEVGELGLKMRVKRSGKPNPSIDLFNMGSLLWKSELISISNTIKLEKKTHRVPRNKLLTILQENLPPSTFRMLILENLSKRKDWRFKAIGAETAALLT